VDFRISPPRFLTGKPDSTGDVLAPLLPLQLTEKPLRSLLHARARGV
jgi:hypothetical protein